ncbi:glucose-1-phosphate adenylyltransferase [Candidatus Fermentibacteria bacterium]|nr:glucose-1-phosphate adenylyltransferase [Candidatus Fermentibacteria bacterium]
MSRIVAIILGGGSGTRLFPLTQQRSKPAVPVGGKYRLIDIPVSNCINDGIKQILVLTQFNSESLNRHVAQTYRFDRFTDGFVSILAAEQTNENKDWFQGTADAVRKSLRHILDLHPEQVLILSGDQLYRMNFRDFDERHTASGADITIATKPVTRREAPGLGIMQISRDGRIVHFREKPSPDELDSLVSRGPGLDDERPLLGSMGIYMFKPEVLEAVLKDDSMTDFGKQVIPSSIGEKRVFAYLFNGYWSDIGTIGSFFEANLDLASDRPALDLYKNYLPIYTRARALPGARVRDCRVDEAVICEASEIAGADIRRCIIGLRSKIRRGSTLEEVVIMGADYWEGHFRDPAAESFSLPPLGIGENCVIRRAIIDKNARIGAGSRLVNEKQVENLDGDNYYIRDGIIVVPKNGVIRENTDI